MADNGMGQLPTQRPLTFDEARDVLAPAGELGALVPAGAGTFSAVQIATLAGGRRLAVKCSVPDALPGEDGARLLTYERGMLRSERDVLALVADDGAVPAPAVALFDDSRARVEVDVLATEFLPGTPWVDVAADMDPSATRTAGEAVGGILAALQRHPHMPEAEPKFGYPADGFALGAARFDDFFVALMEAVMRDAERWGVDVEPVRTMRAVERAEEALAEVREPRLIHNDLWLGNVLLEPATGAVGGVIDFERALFADPLWDFVGADSHNTGPFAPDVVRGYEAAGGGPLPRDPATESGLTESADARVTLYRLWSMAVQAIEVVPRGFHGDWLARHLAAIARNRGVLLERAGV